jgi:hypothetical protein
MSQSPALGFPSRFWLCMSVLPLCPAITKLSAIRALSRSGKKVLHVDKNSVYGGPDAALSLHEAEDWVSTVNQGEMPFYQ